MVRRIAGVAVLSMLLGSAAWAADGAAVYKEKCSKCHGETGMADTATGKSMKVPALAGDAKVAKMSEDEIVAAVKENKKHKDPVKTLPDDVLKAAAGYVKSLASK